VAIINIFVANNAVIHFDMRRITPTFVAFDVLNDPEEVMSE
jgi:hypothetical protein